MLQEAIKCLKLYQGEILDILFSFEKCKKKNIVQNPRDCRSSVHLERGFFSTKRVKRQF